MDLARAIPLDKEPYVKHRHANQWFEFIYAYLTEGRPGERAGTPYAEGSRGPCALPAATNGRGKAPVRNAGSPVNTKQGTEAHSNQHAPLAETS